MESLHFQTPLHAAAGGNKEKFLELLLEYGADFNLADSKGCSPMDVAVKNNSFNCIESMQMHIGL